MSATFEDLSQYMAKARKELPMPQHGKSLYEALQDAGAVESGHGTVFYNGEDGNRAVYDVTAQDEGAAIINGNHLTIDDQQGLLAVFRNFLSSEKYFNRHGIDTQHGWQRVP
jgi:hypothetical protein